MNKIIIFVFALITIMFFRNIFDHGIYKYSSIEIQNNFLRREYLGNELGIVYKNRFGLLYFDELYPKITKIKSLFFQDLSNVYLYMPLIYFLIYKGMKNYSNEK